MSMTSNNNCLKIQHISRLSVDGGSSSMVIVLNWPTSGSNYQRWRGS
ncbi:hypothetical protein VP01_104g4 [Puccinia sorghi]|uniref:Uncharacterized protein n=1 Tax=Puccinia sorghi TaxID=27349 RepID=A0A0L6VU99_9BASI|nr:hypothetical protein VP01_104g4 [Puccinia sorghi]